MACEWSDKVFSVTPAGFDALALEIFLYQCDQNPVYRSYLHALRVDPSGIKVPEDIPFLPIRFFKTHEVKTGNFEAQAVFTSSGTTHTGHSRHYLKDTALYTMGAIQCFEKFYGPVQDWCITALLPSYLERENSSLVYMVKQLISRSGHPGSAFYLDEYEQLNTVLKKQEAAGQKTLLIGVTFALLDFAEKYPQPLHYTCIMETGGMKGRREEITRQEVHNLLSGAFHIDQVHSEYGMTELLSQAYSKGKGLFETPAWMKVLIRDEEDPLFIRRENPASGAINIIDLANVHSCSFIATDDVGRRYTDGRFEVLGRMDGSDLRGCSLLAV